MSTPAFVGISGFKQDAFYKAPAGKFPGRTAAQGGFTASVLVWPQGTPPETHCYFANTDGATYGWWIERDAADNFSVNAATTGGVTATVVTSPPGSVGRPMLIQLTLASSNIIYIIINGTAFSPNNLGADVYVPAPGAAVATLGAQDTAGTNPTKNGLLAGAAYTEPAEDISLSGIRWAACTVARDMVDPPAVYGNVGEPYTNLYSARRGNNGQGRPVALPGLGFLSPNPTWRDEHGLVTLTREGNAGLLAATILNS